MSEDDALPDTDEPFRPLPNILIFVYQELKYLLELEVKESESIFNSANNVIGWNGLIISVLLTGGGLFISSEKVALNGFELIMLILTIVSLGSSIIIVFVFQLRTPSIRIHSPHSLMDRLLHTQNTAAVLGHLVLEIYESIKTNQKANQIKRGRIVISQTAFLVGISIAIAFLIYHSYILYMVDINKGTDKLKNPSTNTIIPKYILDKIKQVLDKEHQTTNKHSGNESLFMDRKWFRFWT